MPSVMRPKVKVKSDSRPSAGTRIKSGGTEDMPVRVKALPDPKVGRGGGGGGMKPPPMGNHMESGPAIGPGRSFFGGGRGAVDNDYGPPVERMPPMMRGGMQNEMPPMMGGGMPSFDEWAEDNPRMMPMDIGPGSANERAMQAYREEYERSGGNPRGAGEDYAEAASNLMNRLGLVGGSSTGRLSQQAIANGQTNDTGNPRLDFMPRQGFREGEMDGQTPWEQMHKGRPLKKKKKKKRYTPNKPKEDYAEVMSGGVIKQPKGAK